MGNDPSAVAAGDLNGDGIIDLAVANANSSDVSVLLGYGDGTFAVERRFAGRAFSIALVIGDFNEDGIVDLAVANGSSDDVSILLGLSHPNRN